MVIYLDCVCRLVQDLSSRLLWMRINDRSDGRKRPQPILILENKREIEKWKDTNI